jgi:hypothetical protein
MASSFVISGVLHDEKKHVIDKSGKNAKVKLPSKERKSIYSGKSPRLSSIFFRLGEFYPYSSYPKTTRKQNRSYFMSVNGIDAVNKSRALATRKFGGRHLQIL